MTTFLLEIVTPDRVAFTQAVDSVYAPTPDGTIGVLAHHMPLFTSLVEGEVKISTKEKDYYLAIGGGFMEVTKDKVSVLVSRAVHADEINEAEIEKAQTAAKEVLERQVKGIEYEQAQAIMRRSLIEFKVLNRHKRKSSSTLL